MGKAGVKFEVIREIISQHGNELGISLLCGIAGVPRSGYCSWLKAEEARQARAEKGQILHWCWRHAISAATRMGQGAFICASSTAARDAITQAASSYRLSGMHS